MSGSSSATVSASRTLALAKAVIDQRHRPAHHLGRRHRLGALTVATDQTQEAADDLTDVMRLIQNRLQAARGAARRWQGDSGAARYAGR